MKNSTIALTVLAFALLIGCTNTTKEDSSTTNKNFEVSLDNSEVKVNALPDEERVEDVVFYNLFSPLDMDKIIDQKSSYFNPAYINTLNNITKYTSSHKAALNIGVYGADLSYLWIFDQTQQALSYLTAIKQLTDKLGIPEDLVENTYLSAEQNSNEIDSLIIISRDAYLATDRYLKANKRENSALLILLGGWVETMYIALNMYNEADSKLASKIITQKYSLTSLITIVQNYPDDIVMSEYLLLMRKMKDAFQIHESQLKPSDVDIDTVNRRITIKDTDNLNIKPENFHELKAITTQIRNYIIE